MRDDHSKLRQEFSVLEAGRLTRLESEFALTKAEMHIRAKNIAMWWSTGTAIIVSVITAIIIKYLNLY